MFLRPSVSRLRFRSFATTTTSSSSSFCQDPNAVFVVCGATGGVGSEFVRQLLQTTQGHVVAASRSAALPPALPEAEHHRVHPLQLDVTKQETIDSCRDYVASLGGRIDGVINTIGVLSSEDGGRPERSLKEVNREWLRHSVEVNALGAVFLYQALEPHIRAAARAGSSPLVVNLSARVGSISDNRLGGWWSYRCSKAALNMLTRNLHLEWSRYGVRVAALHPGTVDTKLSAPFSARVKHDVFSPEESVGKMMKVLDGLEQSHSGYLYDYAGTRIDF